MIISVKRNFLELKNINELIKKNKPEDNYSIEKTKPDFQLNRFFYKQIGKKYRWTDRLIWTDLQWSNYVSNKNLETYVIKNDDDLEAEIYISVEMARINSKEFNVSLDNELSRLIIHGVLHLIGFNDDTEDSKKIMFLKQEEIISNFSGNVCSE